MKTMALVCLSLVGVMAIGEPTEELRMLFDRTNRDMEFLMGLHVETNSKNSISTIGVRPEEGSVLRMTNKE